MMLWPTAQGSAATEEIRSEDWPMLPAEAQFESSGQNTTVLN